MGDNPDELVMRGVSAGNPDRQRPGAAQSWPVALRDAASMVVVCAVMASAVNGIRGDGIPFIQKEAYEILVPCPETTGTATAVAPDTAKLRDQRVAIIDGRPAEAFQRWHLARALNVPYDYLEPMQPTVIRRIAASGAREVLVYGDGDDPDSGEQLARELAGKGIKNVGFVKGGAPALLALEMHGAPQ
jgi:hypothetical protein